QENPRQRCRGLRSRWAAPAQCARRARGDNTPARTRRGNPGRAVCKPNAALMNALRQVQNGAPGVAAHVDDDWLLLGHGALHTRVVKRDELRGRNAKVPLDFGSTVVVTSVVTIDDQAHLLARRAELVLELCDGVTRVPQADQVGTGD